MKSPKRIYLDYASITPIDPRVLRVMTPYLKDHFANASSLYREGVKTKSAIESARKEIADILKAHSDEIVMTSGGTEANNLAIFGAFEAARRLPEFKNKKPHIVTTTIEHPSILEACGEIERRGGLVSYVPVDQNGIVSAKEIKKALKPNTILISVMYANNEIGTIQPIREIAKTVRQFRKIDRRNQQLFGRLRPGKRPWSGLPKSSLVSKGSFPYFHTDASQVANYLDLNVERLGVDLMTIDSTKIYGPRGAGFLFARRRLSIDPVLWGGGQESGRRPGTENTAAVIGTAAALKISESEKFAESKRLTKLRDYFIDEVLKNIKGASLNGHRNLRLPNNANICIPTLDAEFAVLQFDAKGIAISSVTSCRNIGEDSSSYVVEAIGKKKCAISSLRFSFGRDTTKVKIDYCLKILYIVANGRAH